MANVKITELTGYTNPASTDVLPIVDVGNDTTKKVTIADLLENAGSGTAGAPAFAFDGDADTGIYRPGADQLAISTNGTQRINIEADGDINIDSGGVFYDATNNRLGIGTTLPSSLLHLNGSSPDLTIQDSQAYTTSDGPLVQFQGRGPNATNYNFGYIRGVSSGANNAGILQFATNSAGTQSVALTVDSSQRVGIGTTSVSNLLHLRSDSSSNVDFLYLQNRNGGANAGARIAFSNGTVDYGDNRYAYIGAVNTGASESGNSLVFATNANGGVATEKVRLDSSGRLLVGTTSARSINFNNTIGFQSEGALNYQAISVTSNGGTDQYKGASIYLARTRGTGVGQNTAVANDDSLGSVEFYGANGTDLNNKAASISCFVDGDPFTAGDTTDLPGRLQLSTTSDGASSPTERVRIDAEGALSIFNGTAPTVSATNGVKLYAEDVSSSSELKVRDEAGNVTTLSPHNFDLIPEGPSEDMAWSYYSERDGKRINVDMLKAVRLLEQLSGEQLVFTS